MKNNILGWLDKPKTTGNCGFPLTNLQKGRSIDFVPDDNIGKNLEDLCIRRGNLKYLEGKIADANLKKIGYPDLFP